MTQIHAHIKYDIIIEIQDKSIILFCEDLRYLRHLRSFDIDIL